MHQPPRPADGGASDPVQNDTGTEPAPTDAAVGGDLARMTEVTTDPFPRSVVLECWLVWASRGLRRRP